jgi:hypothetical protein
MTQGRARDQFALGPKSSTNDRSQICLMVCTIANKKTGGTTYKVRFIIGGCLKRLGLQLPTEAGAD